MKTILKMILGLAIGCSVGLLIGLGAAVLFSDKTWSEAWANLIDEDSRRLLLPAVWAMVAAIIGFVVQVIVHEGGHLVAGLLTGYRFVSFRVFEYTLIRKDGRYQWRRFSLGSTGGQCLMTMPERPLNEIDTRWYNAGGVLANVLLSSILLLLCYFCDLSVWLLILFVMTAAIGLFMALTNGIPMKIGGMNNDGYNLLNLEKHPQDKLQLCRLLEANALIQDGTEPKDMPEEWFIQEDPIDWGDALQANWQMMRLARMENEHDFERVYTLLTEALADTKRLVRLFFLEFSAEMTFVCLATGRIEEARQYYTKDVEKYVRQFAKSQSSKQRVLFAVKLLMEEKPDDAQQILTELKSRRSQYLLQGEVAMDLELMEWINTTNNKF